MIHENLEDTDTQQIHGYPIEPDTDFTTDEVEAIALYKQELAAKLNRNHGVLKGIETTAWGLSSYCLAKFLIYASGTAGLFPAIAIVLGINQIVNRDLLEFRINKTIEGWEFEDMQKLVRFCFSFLFGGFILWGAVGDFFHTINSSKQTYADIKQAIASYEKLPGDDKNTTLIIGFVVGGLVVYALRDRR